MKGPRGRRAGVSKKDRARVWCAGDQRRSGATSFAVDIATGAPHDGDLLDRIVVVGAGNTGVSMLERLRAIVPVMVLDAAAEPVAEVEKRYGDTPSQSDGEVQRHNVKARLADGTSRLVLEDVRGDAARTVALVAATGDDRVNLEICRLAAVVGFGPIVAIAIDPERVKEYTALGAKPVARARLLGDAVERAVRFEGVSMASNVGLGRGDVVEIRVLASSPMVGTPLSDLRADGWRVAAIYRDDALVLPTGTTSVNTDDRVLLVGAPEMLAHVADKLRRGEPNFPWRHGANVVLYLPNRDDAEIAGEAKALLASTAADRLVRVQPKAADAKADHARLILEHNPGVVVMRPEPRSAMQRLFGIGGRDVRLCNALPVPVLFPRGDVNYERVIYVVAPEIADLVAADDAIDLARMLDVPLVVAKLAMPEFFGPRDPEVDRVVAAVERLGRLHAVDMKVMDLEGNPVREVAKIAGASDLVVVNRSRLKRDSFAAPDVALRIAHAVPCSALVVTAAQAS